MSGLLHLLLDAVPVASPGIGVDQFTNLSMAGLMGAMWLWERRNSRQREQQIDEAHGRIVGDRVQLEQLLDVVRQNTEAMTRLASVQEDFVRRATRGGES
jgi:hypothetical protein